MAKINLLPWREERRREQTRRFGGHALLGLMIAGGLVMAGLYHVKGLIDHQNARNAYLQQEIDILQEKLREIERLEETKAKLLARMEIIQQLQTARPQVVHLFHELAATLPEGVFLMAIKQQGESLALEGKAESNARVSAFMRNLDASDWLKLPVLEVIEVDQQDESVSSFKLRLQQTTPNAAEDEISPDDEVNEEPAATQQDA